MYLKGAPVRIISKTPLRRCWNEHPDAKGALQLWWKVAAGANWTKAADIKAAYGNASILANDRVVFNICGRKYRLVTLVRYKWHLVYVRFVGTHDEYDEINAEEV